MDTNVIISFVPALGMIIVAAVAVIYWRRISLLPMRWFWLGAGLWTIAVLVKIICAVLANEAALRFLKGNLPYPFFVLGGGLFLGIESSLCEIGLTLIAVYIWRQLGKDAETAIGIGVGAGAFEALFLGLTSLIGIIVVLVGVPGTEKAPEEIDTLAALTPLFLLLAPAERIIALLCHTSSRALVLLGAKNRKPMMIFYGFLIFTLLDGMAGAAEISGKLENASILWIELAMLPLALISIPILRWCYAKWTRNRDASVVQMDGNPPKKI